MFLTKQENLILDKQYAFSIIIILFGFGLMQIKDENFLVGLGFGTVAIGVFWLVIQIIRTIKNPKTKLGK